MEVETKYALSEQDFKRISVIFASRVAENLFKKDTYFSKYNTFKKGKSKGEPLIRIREENKKAYLTLKNKGMKDGFENNIELETFVENPDVLKSLLLALGLKEIFYKEKDAWSIYREVTLEKDVKVPVHMELEKVNSQYYYIEIEVTDDVTMDQAKQALSIVAGELKVTEEMKDNRTWPEILGVKA